MILNTDRLQFKEDKKQKNIQWNFCVKSSVRIVREKYVYKMYFVHVLVVYE